MRKYCIESEDWPRCAKCDMPVETFCVLETTEDALMLVAKCHGEREVVTVPRAVLVDMDLGWQSLELGPAFADGEKQHVESIDANQRTQEAGTRLLS